MCWDTLANVATVLEALVVIFAAFYALLQYREALKGRRLTVTLEMIELLGNTKIKKAIKSLDDLPDKPEELAQDQWNQIEFVSHSFSRVGLLVKHKLLDEDVILDMYAETISSTWSKLKHYIEFQREVKGQHYQYHFEDLNKLSSNYNRPSS